MNRKKTRRIYIGNVPIGDGAPIAVQSMTKTDTRDIFKTVKQIKELEKLDVKLSELLFPIMKQLRQSEK
jgi:4-hydroxy-3-methylbut-2-en-1-yl diphosphate synthase (EC 1.17.4.3)